MFALADVESIASVLFVLAAITFALSVIRDPVLGVLGIIAVMYILPFAVGPTAIGPFHLTFLDVALTITLVIWLGIRLATFRGVRGGIVSVLLLVFIAITGVALVAGWAMLTAEQFRFYLKMVNSLLVMFTMLNCLTTRESINRTVRFLMFCAGVAAAMGLLFYYLPAQWSTNILSSLAPLGYPKLLPLRYIAGTDDLRAIGTAIDPNLLGAALACALPVIIAQVVSKEPLLSRRYLVGLGLMVGWALLLTYSRTAWGAAIVGVVFVAIVRYRILAIPFGGLMLLSAVLPQRTLVWGRLMEGLSFSDKAGVMRLGEYQDALRLISAYPILGVGFGFSPDYHYYVGTSSGYLLLAERTGLVGLAACLCVLIAFFVTTWQQYRHRRYPWGGGMTIGLLGAVVVALSAALFDHYFFNPQFPHTVALLWLLIGLTSAAARLDM